MHSMKTASKKVAMPIVLDIKIFCIAITQSLHVARDAGICQFFEQKMKVIRHKTVTHNIHKFRILFGQHRMLAGMLIGFERTANMPGRIFPLESGHRKKESAIVRGREKNIPFFHAAIIDVIKFAGGKSSRFSLSVRHKSIMAYPLPNGQHRMLARVSLINSLYRWSKTTVIPWPTFDVGQS